MFSIVAGIFFVGLTVTMVVAKGVLMSHEFAKAEMDKLNEKPSGEKDA